VRRLGVHPTGGFTKLRAGCQWHPAIATTASQAPAWSEFVDRGDPHQGMGGDRRAGGR
jgi:hypothetical protein